MSISYIKKWRRTSRAKKKRAVSLVAILVVVVIISLFFATLNRRLAVDQASYQPLLNLIARVESRDNYNAYFGNAVNTEITFTKMSISAVQAWQEDFVARGNPSSAVGRYQIISTTLDSLVTQLELDTDRQFDESLQDELAIALLERRGGEAYINDELTKKQFAANLAQEWAALPKVIGDNPSASYYDGDGLNKSLVEIDEVLKVIDPIEAK